MNPSARPPLQREQPSLHADPPPLHPAITRLALSLFATLAAAGEPKPARIVSTTPSVADLLGDGHLVASAATARSPDQRQGFFSQWAKVADNVASRCSTATCASTSKR